MQMCSCLATKSSLFPLVLHHNPASSTSVVRFTTLRNLEKNKQQKLQQNVHTKVTTMRNSFRLLDEPHVVFIQPYSNYWFAYRKYQWLYDWSFNFSNFHVGAQETIQLILKKISEQKLKDLDGILPADLIQKMETKLRGIKFEDRQRFRSFGPESYFVTHVAQFEIQKENREVQLVIFVVAENIPSDKVIRDIDHYHDELMACTKNATVVNIRFTKRLMPVMEDDFSIDQFNVFAKFDEMTFNFQK